MPSFETKNARHWSGWKNPIWWVFCLPGAVFMWIQYWFPGSGQILMSSRQYGSRFMQVVYSVIIYVGFYLIFIHNSGN